MNEKDEENIADLAARLKEAAYELGKKMAYSRMLNVCIAGLGQNGTAEQWRSERAAVVAKLRELCEEFGDNDWTDDMHLADVLEKHMAQHLWENRHREEIEDQCTT